MAQKVIRVKLPPALGMYTALFKPRPPPPNNPTGKPKYGITLLFPKAQASKLLAELTRSVAEVATMKWGASGAAVVKKMRYPVVRDGDEYYEEDPEGRDSHFKGHVFVRASSYTQPGVVDGGVQDVFDDAEAYSGCTFRAVVALYPFDTNGNKGVGIGLNNVMVVDKGPRLDGRKSAAEEFAEYAGDRDEAGSDTDI